VENYIVRIYRNAPEHSRDIVGVVETVGAGEKKVFTNVDELWDIINPRKNEKSRVTTVRAKQGR